MGAATREAGQSRWGAKEVGDIASDPGEVAGGLGGGTGLLCQTQPFLGQRPNWRTSGWAGLGPVSASAVRTRGWCSAMEKTRGQF